MIGPISAANLQQLASTKVGEPTAKTPDAKSLKAARDFEAVFLRKMLSSLEKTSHLGGGPAAAGGDIYGSMMVGVLADAVSAAGGVGMADVIAQALTKAGGTPPANDPKQGDAPTPLAKGSVPKAVPTIRDGVGK